MKMHKSAAFQSKNIVMMITLFALIIGSLPIQFTSGQEPLSSGLLQTDVQGVASLNPSMRYCD